MLPIEHRRALIFDNINTYDTLGLVMRERDMPPAPIKEYTIDIPGGNGLIDITEAYFGDVAYGNREMSFKFEVLDETLDIEKIRDKVVRLLHGRRKEFSFTFDPDYTYSGRFTVESTKTEGRFQCFEVKINADPFKTKGMKIYKVNANGGKVLRFESGRKKVQPVFECSCPTIVGFGDVSLVLPYGTYKCPDVWFTEGWNEIYLNSWVIQTLTWGVLDEETSKMTWEEAEKYRWFELERYGLEEDITGRTWEELSRLRWSELSEMKWNEVEYQDAGGRVSTTIISYEWSDL